MKKRIFSLFFVSALAMGLLSCTYLQTQQRQLAEKLVRLHVVANSDSPSDQAIKLRVRDAVLAAAEPVLGSADDPEQALAAELPALECAAAEMLRALGREESVSVTLQNERFPTRDYETFSLPAGVYRTLRVTIGAGEGHNWWCVVFPTLCTAASLDEFESAAASGGFTDGLPERSLEVNIPEKLKCKIPPDKLCALTEVLAGDPRPSYIDDPEREFGFPFAGLEILFTVSGKVLTVTGVSSSD